MTGPGKNGNKTKGRNAERRSTTHAGIAWPVLAMVLSAALTAVGCALLLPDREPAILAKAGEVTSVGVSTQQYSGSRQVTVVPVSSASQQLSTQAAGTVTDNLFSGGVLNSGTTVMRVDEAPVIALHTDVPLYRDLALDSVGADVQSLNRELGRLGWYGADPEADRYTWYTQVALQNLFANAGGSADYDGKALSLRSILWLPDQSDTVTGWQARRGGTVTPGAAIGTIPGQLQRFDLQNVTASDRDRTLTIAGESITLPAGATAIDDRAALSKVQSSERYRQETASASGGTGDATGMGGGMGGGGTPNVSATLSLDRPITVLRVPAGAVFGLAGTAGCIASGKRTIPVSIVGSELGVSLVTLDGNDGAAEPASPEQSAPEQSTDESNFPTTVRIGSAVAGRTCK